ncbi:Contactin-Associated Protein-Like 4, partial [Manis pentadactyla]
MPTRDQAVPLMELCTLTPSRVRLHLFLQTAEDLLPASRSTVSVSLGSLRSRFRWMSLLRPPTEIFCPLSFHCLRVLGIASDHDSRVRAEILCSGSLYRVYPHLLCPPSALLPTCRSESFATRSRVPAFLNISWSRDSLSVVVDPETPHKKILILSATRLGPHANEGTGSSGCLMELCTSGHSLTRAASPLLQTADFRWMSLLQAPTEIFCPLSLHCLRVLGIAQITLPFSDEPFGPPQRSSARFSFHCLVSLGSLDHGRSWETPHKKILILLQHVSAPMPQRGDREQWPLDGTLHPDTLTRAFHLFCRQPSHQQSVPATMPWGCILSSLVLEIRRHLQENTDSSATRLAPMLEGPSRPLDGTLHPGHPTLQAASPLLQTADFRFRMSLLRAPTEIFCPLRSTVSVSLGSPQITDFLAAQRFSPSSLMSLLLAPTEIFCPLPAPLLRVLGSPQITLPLMSLLRAPTEIFCPLRSTVSVSPGIAPDHGRSGDTPQENTDLSATRLGPHANEGTEQWLLDGTLHPDTLTRAASLFCRQP